MLPRETVHGLVAFCLSEPVGSDGCVVLRDAVFLARFTFWSKTNDQVVSGNWRMPVFFLGPTSTRSQLLLPFMTRLIHMQWSQDCRGPGEWGLAIGVCSQLMLSRWCSGITILNLLRLQRRQQPRREGAISGLEVVNAHPFLPPHISLLHPEGSVLGIFASSFWGCSWNFAPCRRHLYGLRFH